MKRSRQTGPTHSGAGRQRAPAEYERDVQSVAYFSDAVFAIAMTLLVIGISVPAGTTTATLGHELRGLGSSFTSYGISFIVIGRIGSATIASCTSWRASMGARWSSTCCS